MDQDGDSGSGLTELPGSWYVQCQRGLLKLYNVTVPGQSNSCYIFEAEGTRFADMECERKKYGGWLQGFWPEQLGGWGCHEL